MRPSTKPRLDREVPVQSDLGKAGGSCRALALDAISIPAPPGGCKPLIIKTVFLFVPKCRFYFRRQFHHPMPERFGDACIF